MTRLRPIVICLGACTGAGLVAACYQDVDMDVDPIHNSTRPPVVDDDDAASPPGDRDTTTGSDDDSGDDTTVAPGNDIPVEDAGDDGEGGDGDTLPQSCADTWTMTCDNGAHLICEKVDVYEVTVPSWPPHAAIETGCPGGYPVGMNCDVTVLEPWAADDWRKQFDHGVNCAADVVTTMTVTAECYSADRYADIIVCHNNLDDEAGEFLPPLPPPAPHGDNAAAGTDDGDGENDGQDSDDDGDYDWEDIINDLLGR